MSQSDYSKFKKTATILKELPTALPPVLNSKEYTSFKQYNLETTIENTKPTYNKLKLANKTTIFGMELDVANCTEFKLCNDTNTRPNRKLLLSYQSQCFPVVKAPGLSVPKSFDKSKENLDCDCLNHVNTSSGNRITNRINCGC